MRLPRGNVLIEKDLDQNHRKYENLKTEQRRKTSEEIEERVLKMR
jgi:hypothetical protein